MVLWASNLGRVQVGNASGSRARDWGPSMYSASSESVWRNWHGLCTCPVPWWGGWKADSARPAPSPSSLRVSPRGSLQLASRILGKAVQGSRKEAETSNRLQVCARPEWHRGTSTAVWQSKYFQTRPAQGEGKQTSLRWEKGQKMGALSNAPQLRIDVAGRTQIVL